MDNPFAKIPPVNQILEKLSSHLSQIDQVYIKRIVEIRLAWLREHPERYHLSRSSREEILDHLVQQIENEISALITLTLRRVINCTGVILHTGLGRAPFRHADIQNLSILEGYTNLEIDLTDGKRGDRLDHVSSLLKLLTGAEDALVVHNNAAAVLLALNSLAKGKEVLVSRGELVEIGGSFRMPEVMKSSQARMVEVGTTNKTHLHDYEQAITSRTAAILLVHPSNYQIVGFAEKPHLKDIITLAHHKNLPVIFDLGSGALLDMREFGFDYEPVVADMIEAGMDLLTFSGDKLLGGPQSGIILGKENLIKKIRKNHLLRALRCDKTILSLLSSCLVNYLHRDTLVQNNPTLQLLSRKRSEMKMLADSILNNLKADIKNKVEIVETEGRVGSGAYPVFPVPSLALKLNVSDRSADNLAAHFRQFPTPVVGLIEGDHFVLDLLAVFKQDGPILSTCLNQIL
jgi:L-seryl-tRNA(Ser) seleniumtransferase